MDKANGIVAISARTRYSGMPYPTGSKDDIYYFSYNSGPAHFISLGSFYKGGFGAGSPMTAFLKADLAAVDRAVTPWIVVTVHAPWCASSPTRAPRAALRRRPSPTPPPPLTHRNADNSNTAHTNGGVGMRSAYETMFINVGVSIVVSGGHVRSSLPGG